MGLCSGFLQACSVGDRLAAILKKGSISISPMKHHLTQKKNMICVGPGTGIAPIRGILQHYLTCSNNVFDTQSSKLLVFYGCRRQHKDCLFEDEWRKLNILKEQDGLTATDVSVFVSYSQEGLRKDYVTHAIERNGELVWKMLREVYCY